MANEFKREWHDEICRVAGECGGLRPGHAEFFFLRHGQTEHNFRRIVQPQMGVPLNDAGRRQAEQAAAKLVGRKISNIVASDSDRAWQTAQTVARVCGWPVRAAPDLRERHWGELIGKSNIGLDWGSSPAGGETLADFTTRTLKGLVAALVDSDTLVTAHGGTFYVLTAALGIAYNADQPTNAAPMHFRLNGSGRWQFEQL
ncbi:MAG: histidine phosphatase family protein [Alphaproteobacteria bacterium]|nr:histidine phosphatase family protein [Alphaproteobacteria bacterium]